MLLFGSLLLIVAGTLLTIWATNVENTKWLFAAFLGLLWLVAGVLGVFFAIF